MGKASKESNLPTSTKVGKYFFLCLFLLLFFLAISKLLLNPTYRYYFNDFKENVWTIGAGASDKRKEKCKNRCNNEAASGIKMLRLVANL